MSVASRSRTSVPRMGMRRFFGPTGRRVDTQAREPHQVIQRESVTIDMIDDRGSSTKRLDVRIAIEHVDHVPTLAVTLAEGSTVVMQWPLGESADVLQIFRLFRLLVGMQKINVRYLPNLLRFIRNGSLPPGKNTKKLRRHIGHPFRKAIGYIPTPKDVLGVMIPCREHAIVADTASLTALAARGRFEVTAELKAQGVMDAKDYKARAAKIEQRFADMRPNVLVICEALGIACDGHIESLVREMIGCGVDVELACAYIAATSIADMPVFGYRGYSPQLGEVILFQDVDPVRAGLDLAAEAFQWNARVQQNVERQLFGLIHQNNVESVRDLETDLL
jgi:hypothetical protein